MNQDQRVTYTELALQHELERLGKVNLYSAKVWDEVFLARDDVDPLDVHKRYGLVSPQKVEGKEEMWMGFSAAHMVRAVEDHSDDDFVRWISYWITHVALHLVILDWAVNLGDDGLSLEEIEGRVDSEMKAQGRDLWAFGEQVKLLTPL